MTKKKNGSKATITSVVPIATPIKLSNGMVGKPLLFDPKGAPNSNTASKKQG